LQLLPTDKTKSGFVFSSLPDPDFVSRALMIDQPRKKWFHPRRRRAMSTTALSFRYSSCVGLCSELV